MFWSQSLSILDKNLLIIFRNKKQLFKELCFPLITAAFIVYAKTAGKEFQSFLLSILPIYLPSSVNGFTRRLLVNFVHEKKERYKETQKIMGCQQISYMGGWFMTLYLEAFFVAIITVGAIIYVGTDISYLTLCSLYFGFVLAVTHQTFFLTTFFNSPKLAGELGSFIQTIGVLFYYYMISNDVQIGKYFIFILPQPALSLALMPYLNQKQGNLPSMYSNLDYVDSAGYMIAFDIVFYLALYLWFDQILPNEYGIRKHPFFFIIDCLKYFGIINDDSMQTQRRRGEFAELNEEQGVELQQQQQLNTNNSTNISVNTDSSSAKFHENYDFNQLQLEPTIQIDHLMKEFKTPSKNIKAVNDISIQLYNKQIFCLLGHNGSGKTTTINLLTGMIEKDFGTVKIFGRQFENNFEKIRQNIGLCGQKDVLYEDMNVIEHLRFYGKIKGKKGMQLEQEIKDLIPKIGLEPEKNKLSQNLSGGNKRKLSLGMALIGGSKIVLLDEPTSGMDSVSRRQLWDILQNIKQEDRTIILTTHHLEEAEFLSDRIGIMNRGQLLIVGGSDFIKKKFGIGYHLTISSKQENEQEFIENRENIAEIVKNHINNATQDKQTMDNQLKFTLPFNSQELYANMFQDLEKNPNIIINLEMNTLEEAFVNIELQSQFYEQQDGQNNDYNLSLEQNSTEFSDKQLLTYKPQIRLCNQILSMTVRQYRLILRNWEAWLMTILPIVFCIVGVYITKQLYDMLQEELHKSGIDKQQEFQSVKKEIEEMTMTIFAQLSGFFIVYAYCLNSSVFILTPVREKETEVKYILNVMGAKTIAYWFGTFLADYCCFLIPYFGFVAGVFIFDVVFLVPFIMKMSILVILFGLSLIFYTYAFSFLFSKSNSAFKQFPLINLFLNFTAWFILTGIFREYEYTAYFLEISYSICSPFMLLQKGFGYIQDKSNFMTMKDYENDYKSDGEVNNKGLNSHQEKHMARDSQRRQERFDGEDENFQVYQIFESFEWHIILFLVQIVIYCGIIYYLDKKQKKLQQPKKSGQEVYVQQNIQQLDPTVQKEIERVNQVDNNDPIKAINVHKVYENNFHALKGSTFGVKKREIFALLGPNGSGKSTTFNMLTAKLIRTQGDVLLNNKLITDGFDFSNNFGICPQKDCLWDLLTPVEHLRIFGSIKGMQGELLERAIKMYIKYLDIGQHQNNKSKNLSGGNKRRLCVGISMIGAPELGFFDEPSTGLDPLARRCLHNLLSESNKVNNSSFVLTTHSMAEAEALCNRIGILVNGQFRCLDTLQNLKNLYGKGIYLEIKEENNKFNEVFDIIGKEIPNGSKIGKPNMLHYLIPFENFSFFKIFSLLQKLKDDDLIQDFSIAQSSLEQIFIEFSSQQIELPQQQQ